MYDYKDKRLITKTRLFNYIIPLAILLGFVLCLLLKVIKVESSVIATVVIALLGWPLAVDNIFLQVNNSLRRKIESEAIREIDGAATKISSAFVSVVTFDNDFVVKPIDIPEDLWYKAAHEKHTSIIEETVTMRKAFGDLYRALEANEIAIIHLECYYRYLTIIIGDFIEHIDKLSSDFLLAIEWNMSEEKYKEEVTKLRPLKDEWVTIASYLMDFRKMLQNELLGNVFKRQLEPRKPLPGYGTTLDKVATKEEVQRLIDKRNEKIGLPKGLS